MRPPAADVTISGDFRHKATFDIRLGTRYIALAITLWVSGAIFQHLLAVSSREAQNATGGFPTVYTAARLWLSGARGYNLQDWNWFRRESAALGFTSTDVFWGNPPALALLLTPLAWLPPAQARLAWTVVSLVMWFAGVEWLRRTVAPARDRLSAWTVGLSLAAFAALYDPFTANLHLAQIYTVLFFFESAACVLWLKGSPFGAGLCAGTALALKGYGLPLLALALFRRDRRLLIGAAASLIVLAGLASLRLGAGSWIDFLAVHLSDRSFSGTTVPALQTIRSFVGVAALSVYHPGGTPPVLGKTADVTLSVLSVVLQLILVLRLARNHEAGDPVQRNGTGVSPPPPRALAACIAAGLIFSPHAENHAYCLALACIVLVLPTLGRLNLTSAGLLVAGFLLAWPFHFQTRSVVTGLDLLAAYPRLWGTVLLLAVAISRRSTGTTDGQRTGTLQHSASGIAWIAGLSLVLFYVKPWRHSADGPLLIVSRPKANAISCFRLDVDEREVFSIPVSCTGPFGIAADPNRRWLYSACTDNSKLSMIDLRRGREIRTLDSPRLPAWATVRPGGTEVWVSNEAEGTVTVYEARSATALAEVHTGDGPSDICFTADGETAFVTNEASGTVSWIDASSRKKVRDMAVGKVPQGLVLTPDGRTLVVANYGSDAVSLVSLDEQREIARIATGRGPVDVALSSATTSGLVYVSCFEEGAVSVLDLNQVRELSRVPVGNHVFGIAAHPASKRVYVCSAGTDEIVVLRDAVPPAILRRIHVQGSPTLLTIAR
jgi:YVTN family beta-propeller protein